MLAVTVFANVSLLVFARAASRESEIGVRNALGASRGRIVVQLFVEAVALSALSVVAGLVAARYALGSLWHLVEADSGRALPFWIDDSLTPSTIAYGVGLTMLGAVIIGVFPALRVTAGGLHVRLRQFAAGGGGYRFGGLWTAVIVAQVAVTVMFPAAAFFFHRWVVDVQTRDVGILAQEYLSARLVMDSTNAPVGIGARSETTMSELRRQLITEPGVTAVAFGDRLPGMQHPSARFEVEGDDAPPTYGYRVGIASVDADFFSALSAPLVAGRNFTATDLAVASRSRDRQRVVRRPRPAWAQFSGSANPTSRARERATARAVDRYRRRRPRSWRRRSRRHRRVSASVARLFDSARGATRQRDSRVTRQSAACGCEQRGTHAASV